MTKLMMKNEAKVTVKVDWKFGDWKERKEKKIKRNRFLPRLTKWPFDWTNVNPFGWSSVELTRVELITTQFVRLFGLTFSSLVELVNTNGSIENWVKFSGESSFPNENVNSNWNNEATCINVILFNFCGQNLLLRLNFVAHFNFSFQTWNWWTKKIEILKQKTNEMKTKFSVKWTQRERWRIKVVLFSSSLSLSESVNY